MISRIGATVTFLVVTSIAVVGAQSEARPAGAPSAEQIEFFESKIRPLLANNCFECHSAQVETPFGGLRLDSRETLLAGGDSGPVIVPGDPLSSPLVQRVQGRPVLMPPTGALDATAIASLIEWVEMGAPWPEDSLAAADSPDPTEPFDLERRRRTHWAWQPVRQVEPPAVRDDAWPRDAVDRFILASLEAAGLDPASPADRHTLIRRLSFDLRGLPPTPAEISRFVSDTSPTAYADLVDRYLDSSHFGERWARYWMDLFRYAESHGSEGDPGIPFAWRYRDYLIRAFNGDVPYDQLIREHLAGDLLPRPRLDPENQLNESIIGTAHFRLVEHGYQPVDPWEDRVKWADNQVDVVSKAFLGLSVSCARCHDHKFDAISQKDYYSLFGTLYGARPTQRAIDDETLLDTNKDALAALKVDIRDGLAEAWLEAADTVPTRLLEDLESADAAAGEAESASAREATPEPRDGSALGAWRELAEVEDGALARTWRELGDRWESEIDARERFNREHFETAWDFSGTDYASTVGHGTGRPDAPSPPGEFAIERHDGQLLNGIYPGGAYTTFCPRNTPGSSRRHASPSTTTSSASGCLVGISASPCSSSRTTPYRAAASITCATAPSGTRWSGCSGTPASGRGSRPTSSSRHRTTSHGLASTAKTSGPRTGLRVVAMGARRLESARFCSTTSRRRLVTPSCRFSTCFRGATSRPHPRARRSRRLSAGGWPRR